MLFTFVLVILAVPAVFSCVYLLLLTLLSAPLEAPPRSSRKLRFDLVVPAYNEQDGIARTVASLLSVDWPRDRFRVLVVADNCHDETATVARAAGATVLERHDEGLRAKGYALAHAFAASAGDNRADAVVVVDADAEVSGNLLESFAARIERGAQAIQAHYGILNPRTSWRTQLITIAMGTFHIVRSRARERLGLSCGIRGNGWCVTHALLRAVPYRFFSLGEDVEFGIALGLSGHRVEYAGEAHANADMASTEKTARSQRQRWEQGRFQAIRACTAPLLRAAVRGRSLICLDLACDLLVPPLSYLVVNLLLLCLTAGLLVTFGLASSLWMWLALGCVAALMLHVLRGWQLSGIGVMGLGALVHVPEFIFWRIRILLGKKSGEWVRTERE